MRSGGSSRRFVLLLLLAACILTILFLTNIRSPDHTSSRAQFAEKGGQGAAAAGLVNQVDLTGHVISPKLGNETLKWVHIGTGSQKVC